ncbi:MAG: protoporphyrinogen oxidase [Chloroflexaceae bacterium]|nr:protoporphyrinogen oxidase [Chloroflexaceae bacterium]
MHRDGQPFTVQADQVILAAPAQVVAGLFAELDAAAAYALGNIPAYPLSIVHTGYRREDVGNPLDGFGMLCPSREGRNVLGILWPSSLFAGRAPEGHVLMTTFVGGARAADLALLANAALIDLVVGEQQALLDVVADPVFTRVARWERAIPQYVAGHAARMGLLAHLEVQYPGLHFLGNYRDGVSVERCWHKGHELGATLPLTVQA